jgi:hypothetical protein
MPWPRASGSGRRAGACHLHWAVGSAPPHRRHRPAARSRSRRAGARLPAAQRVDARRMRQAGRCSVAAAPAAPALLRPHRASHSTQAPPPAGASPADYAAPALPRPRRLPSLPPPWTQLLRPRLLRLSVPPRLRRRRPPLPGAACPAHPPARAPCRRGPGTRSAPVPGRESGVTATGGLSELLRWPRSFEMTTHLPGALRHVQLGAHGAAQALRPPEASLCGPRLRHGLP